MVREFSGHYDYLTALFIGGVVGGYFDGWQGVGLAVGGVVLGLLSVKRRN